MASDHLFLYEVVTYRISCNFQDYFKKVCELETRSNMRRDILMSSRRLSSASRYALGTNRMALTDVSWACGPVGPRNCVIACKSKLSAGSCLHHFRTLRYPRWEDYNYESLDKTSNRLFWLGNGMTEAEDTSVGNRK